MAYLKTPKIQGRLNVRITIKDDQGTTTEMILEECDQEKVNKLLDSDIDFSSFTQKPGSPKPKFEEDDDPYASMEDIN